jgi:hypothetical protein
MSSRRGRRTRRLGPGAGDLDDLISAAEGAKHWADNRIAHHGQEPVKESPPPTLDDLDKAIDTIGILFCRYNLLLRGDTFRYPLKWAGVKGDLDLLFRPSLGSLTSRPKQAGGRARARTLGAWNG